MSQALATIRAGVFVLAGLFIAFQLTGGEAAFSSGGMGAAVVDVADLHRGNHSDTPVPGQHGDVCSVTACVSIVFASGGIDYRGAASSSPGDVVPDDFLPRGIFIANDPPVPRFVFS